IFLPNPALARKVSGSKTSWSFLGCGFRVRRRAGFAISSAADFADRAESTHGTGMVGGRWLRDGTTLALTPYLRRAAFTLHHYTSSRTGDMPLIVQYCTHLPTGS